MFHRFFVAVNIPKTYLSNKHTDTQFRYEIQERFLPTASLTASFTPPQKYDSYNLFLYEKWNKIIENILKCDVYNWGTILCANSISMWWRCSHIQ